MVFIVAEIGVNWDGDFELARVLMENAKNAGCNAVKFQAFNEKIVKDHPAAKRLIKSTISKSNIKKIDQISRDIGIEWFCTPMYVMAVELLTPYVKRFKIREYDGREVLNGKSLLLEEILKTGKEVFVSTRTFPANCPYLRNPQIKWLYCIPKYPCTLKEIDFGCIPKFDGYSNHCNDISAPIMAAKKGARIIEVHITQNKNEGFIDNNVSFDLTELYKIAKEIRIK